MYIYQLNKNYMLKEILTILVILLANMIHPFVSILIHLYLIKFSLNGKVESIKSLIISFTIYFLNPGIFKIHNSVVPLLRWIIFFVCIFNILRNTRKSLLNKKWVFVLLIWTLYTLLISIIKSNLPMISIMKLFMFYLGFMAVNIGIIDSKKYYDWKRWIFIYFITIHISSLLLIGLPVGYFRNGTGFQGILNQPNAFGIIMAVILSFYIYLNSQDNNKEYSNFLSILIISGIVMLLCSKSRTSMIALSLSIINFIIVFIKNTILKQNLKLRSIVITLFITIIMFILTILNYSSIVSSINELIYKGGNENLLYSSQNVIDNQEEAIKNSFFIGNGFGVEWYPNQKKSFEISLSHPIEKRNIFLALLSETGIIGTIIFIIFIIEYTGIFIKRGLKYVDCIFISTFAINFGEMVFFSGNGIGIFVWFMLGFYKSEISK